MGFLTIALVGLGLAKVMSSLEGGLLGEDVDVLGDVDGEVADPLQFAVDSCGGEEEAKIAGHRLAGRQEPQHLVVNLDLEPIDLLLAPGNLGGCLRVAAWRMAAVAHRRRLPASRPPEDCVLSR